MTSPRSHVQRWWPVALIAVFFIAVVYAAWYDEGSSASRIVHPNRPAPSTEIPVLAVGAETHGIEANQGSALRLPLPKSFGTTSLGGEPWILHVWASWCSTCFAERPVVHTLAKAVGDRLYGVTYRDLPKNTLSYLEEYGSPYAAVGADLDGQIAVDWGISGVPETLLVDTEGMIRWKIVGPLTPDIVHGALREAYIAAGGTWRTPPPS